MRLNFRRWERRHIERVLLFKLGLTATFVSVYFLPPSAAAAVSVASNTFWLWKVKG